jgi:hypothetical protein
MLDDLVQTADARGSRWRITFWPTAEQSCVRSGGWACGARRPLKNAGLNGKW